MINKRREQEIKIKAFDAFIEEQKQKESQAAADTAPIMGPILGGGRLMLTQGMTGL